MARPALLAAGLLLALPACREASGVSRVPPGQEARVARIAEQSPDTAPARTGGFLAPRRTGREIRAQAVRPPTPGPIHPPPPGT